MNHQGTKHLETKRLILRPFIQEDASAMYRNWASNQLVTKYLTWPIHASEEATKSLLKDWVQCYSQADYYQWAIELKELGEVIGSLAVVGIQEDIGEAEIGYCIGSEWWGKGIMPEAAMAVIQYLFEKVGFQRISACHDKNNPQSGRVMQKIGMQYEGTMRKADRNNQGIIDKVVYAILKEDYQKNA